MQPVNNQLLTVETVHAFCEAEIKGVGFFLILKKIFKKLEKI